MLILAISVKNPLSPFITQVRNHFAFLALAVLLCFPYNHKRLIPGVGIEDSEVPYSIRQNNNVLSSYPLFPGKMPLAFDYARGLLSTDS